MTRQTDIKSQKARGRPDGWTDRQTDGRTYGRMDGRTDGQTGGQMDRRTDGQTGKLYCHSGYLNPRPATTCAAQSYELCEWTFIADLNPLF